MPKFFFDIYDDDFEFVDDVGNSFPDLNAAKIQASLAMAEVAQDALRTAGSDKGFAIHIRNESGRLVLKTSLTFMSQRVD
jgi:hypothetical protein